MKNIIFVITVLFFSISIFAQSKNYLIIRMDDLGMCHSVNMGAEKVFKTGLPVNASLMPVCSWFPEAVEMIKKYPNVAVGVHLTLNSEWKNYKWRPLSGSENVPSLTDSRGYFRVKNAWWWKDSVNLDEVEKEFRLQIETVLKTGLKVSYFDSHMACWRQNETMFALVEKLAKEYKVGLSGYFSETRMGVKETFLAESLSELMKNIETIKKNEINLLIFHPGIDTPEMQALYLEDGSAADYKSIAVGRNAAVEAVSSKEFINALKNKQIEVINYKDLILLKGLNNMIRPK